MKKKLLLLKRKNKFWCQILRIIIFFKLTYRIVVSHVVHFKLIDNDEREQVDHHKLNCHNKSYKKGWRILRTAVVAFCAVGSPRPSVVHKVVPTFTCCNNEHQLYGVVKIDKTFVLIKRHSFPLWVYCPEEKYTQNRKYEKY